VGRKRNVGKKARAKPGGKLVIFRGLRCLADEARATNRGDFTDDCGGRGGLSCSRETMWDWGLNYIKKRRAARGKKSIEKWP